jgi:hypothetical protein
MKRSNIFQPPFRKIITQPLRASLHKSNPLEFRPKIWLNAADTKVSSIIQSGNILSRLIDQTNNGSSGIQLTGSSQPSTNVAKINGLNAIRFSKGKSIYGSLTTPQRFTIFIVARLASGATNGTGVVIFGGPNGIYIRHDPVSESFSHSLFIKEAGGSLGPRSKILPSTGLLDAAYLVEATYDGATLTITRNNSLTASTLRTIVIDSATTFGISNTFNCNLDVGEVILFDRYMAATDLDRSIIREELNDKWRIY